MSFACDRFESNQLHPVVDTTFNLSQVADAHEYMKANKNMGKIVMLIDE